MKSLNKYLKQIENLNEMARVGDIDNITLFIYSEPLGNPSFHIKYKNEYEVVLTIKNFDILEWKHKKDKTQKDIPREHKKSIIKFLNNTHKIFNVSNWIYLLDTWNVNNPKYKISINTKISNF